MRRSGQILGGLAICAAAIFAPGQHASAAAVLITEAEAKLPPPKGALGMATRGITRGPKIEFVSGTGEVRSPMRLQVKFESFGGATIDPNSLKIIYLKNPTVDLTERVKPYIRPDGIDMPDAVLPVGDHSIRVDVKDSDGRPATSSIVLKVQP